MQLVLKHSRSIISSYLRYFPIRRFSQLFPVIARNSRRFFIRSPGYPILLAVSFWGSRNDDKSSTQKDGVDSMDNIIENADLFYNQYMIDNAYAGLKHYEDTNNYQLLWRLARVTSEKGQLAGSKEERKKFTYEAFRYIEKALKNAPKEGYFAVHKWHAILLNQLGEFEGNKWRIEKASEVKLNLERALQLNPRDTTTWHILGVWHYTMATLSFCERLAASVFFTQPPTSTIDEALEFFEKAESLQPNFYSSNLWYIAEILYQKGDHDQAVQFYKKAFSFGVVSVADGEIHKKAYDKLTKMGIEVDNKLTKM